MPSDGLSTITLYKPAVLLILSWPLLSSRKHAYIILTPPKPHLYIVKLGFAGVNIIFLISAQKHWLWYSLEPPRRGGSNEYPQSVFWAEMWKIKSEFLIWKFSIFGGEIFYICEWWQLTHMYEYISLLLADLLFFIAKALDSCQTNIKKDINLISKESGINLYQSLDKFCRRHFGNMFSYFSRNIGLSFMQTGDHLHVISRPIFWKKKKEQRFKNVCWNYSRIPLSRIPRD